MYRDMLYHVLSPGVALPSPFLSHHCLRKARWERVKSKTSCSYRGLRGWDQKHLPFRVVWVRIASLPEMVTGCHPVRVRREHMIGGKLIKFTGRGRGSRGGPAGLACGVIVQNREGI
jgi:hypothetical protein